MNDPIEETSTAAAALYEAWPAVWETVPQPDGCEQWVSSYQGCIFLVHLSEEGEWCARVTLGVVGRMHRPLRRFAQPTATVLIAVG